MPTNQLSTYPPLPPPPRLLLAPYTALNYHHHNGLTALTHTHHAPVAGPCIISLLPSLKYNNFLFVVCIAQQHPSSLNSGDKCKRHWCKYCTINSIIYTVVPRSPAIIGLSIFVSVGIAFAII